jgi:hypothetical protein
MLSALTAVFHDQPLPVAWAPEQSPALLANSGSDKAHHSPPFLPGGCLTLRLGQQQVAPVRD